MFELYQLEQLLAVAEQGTLSNGAEQLHISQPALSRNMKKLEEHLEIPLFDRQKNKLMLNENGKYVLTLARKVLEEADALEEKAREFDRRQRMIRLGVCAPAPVWLIVPLLSRFYPQMSLQTETDSDARLLEKLDKDEIQLAVLHEPVQDERYFCKMCGKESLLFALPRGHRYARRKSLSFAEMNGENMLLMGDIGFWDFVCTEKMPDSRFLTQSDRFSFNELVQASTLASFTSDLAEKCLKVETDRVYVPISDPSGSVTYYLVCMKAQKREFSALFSAI